MIDTHCHLTHPRFRNDLDAVLTRAREAGLVACVTVGTGIADSEAVRDLAALHPGFIYGTAGLDPFSAHAAADRFDEDMERLADVLASGVFCAVGEIGLDYHHDLDPRPVQATRFERQLELAVASDLPIVIHVRDAHDDLATILAAHPRARGVIHSFTGGPREAERYLEIGWYLAFNGVVTFPHAAPVRKAARLVPAERLVVETDSPYLAPAPFRGTRCEPAHVRRTLEVLAEVRGVHPHELAKATTANAVALLRLAVP